MWLQHLASPNHFLCRIFFWGTSLWIHVVPVFQLHLARVRLSTRLCLFFAVLPLSEPQKQGVFLKRRHPTYPFTTEPGTRVSFFLALCLEKNGLSGSNVNWEGITCITSQRPNMTGSRDGSQGSCRRCSRCPFSPSRPCLRWAGRRAGS